MRAGWLGARLHAWESTGCCNHPRHPRQPARGGVSDLHATTSHNTAQEPDTTRHNLTALVVQVSRHAGFVHSKRALRLLHPLVARAAPHILDCGGGAGGVARGRVGGCAPARMPLARFARGLHAPVPPAAWLQPGSHSQTTQAAPLPAAQHSSPSTALHSTAQRLAYKAGGDVCGRAGLPLLLAPQLNRHLLRRIVQPRHKALAHPRRAAGARAGVPQPQLVAWRDGVGEGRRGGVGCEGSRTRHAVRGARLGSCKPGLHTLSSGRAPP